MLLVAPVLFRLFTIPRVRRATIASGVVMLAQQMCGINVSPSSSLSLFAGEGEADERVMVPFPSSSSTDYRLLLLHHLRTRRIHPKASSVRVSRIRCGQLRLRLACNFHHRSLWTTSAPSRHFPRDGPRDPRSGSSFPDPK